MKIPRLTKSIFLDQFIYMQIVGVVIGLSFPPFLLLYGFSAHEVITWKFFLVTQIAGQTVGLISFMLISMVIRPHLKLLSQKMHEIAQGLQEENYLNYTASCSKDICSLDVVSDDEIGVSAKAYNRMLDSLLDSHETERVFNKFSKVMSENLEEKSLAEGTISLLLSSTKVEAATILVYSKGKFEVAGSKGVFEPEVLASHQVVKEMVRSGNPVKIRLPKNIQLDAILTQFPPSEVFVSPINFKGAFLGCVVAATGSELADEHTSMILQLFTRNMGLALNNALIHSKFQRLAAFDGLTDVYNRRFGLSRLQEDFARSMRDNTPLSLIMVDVDHFKNINDNYGHLVGDKAIILVASVLKKCARHGDVVVRYGGEEFLMVLPGAGLDDAEQLAEKVRHQIKDSAFHDGDQHIHLSASLGVSSFPHSGADDEMTLLEQADQALYSAKQNGRDQVSVIGRQASS